MNPDRDMAAPDEANDHAFVRPEEECPTVDFDVEKILFLIRFLEKVRNHILSKEWVEEVDFGLSSRKVRHTLVITEQNLKDIIDGLKERVGHAQSCVGMERRSAVHPHA